MRYNFKCKDCGFVFSEKMKVDEYVKKIEKKDIPCPDCNSNEVVRTYSPPGVHYKSAGFYTIDKDLDDPAVADVMDTTRSKKNKK